MAMAATSVRKRWNWRRIVFSILAALFGLQSLAVGLLILAPSPWLGVQATGGPTVEISRWHFAQGGAVAGILMGMLLLAVLWRPERKPVLLQMTAVGLLNGLINTTLQTRAMGFDPVAWINPGMIALLIATYPAPHALVRFSGEGRLSRSLLALALLAGLLLLPDIWRNLRWQLMGIGKEQIMRNYWISAILFDCTLVLAGVLTAIKRPGWQVLGMLLGLAYLYLGAAALALPTAQGSWGTGGGMAAIAGGITCIAAVVWEAWRTPRNIADPAVATT